MEIVKRWAGIDDRGTLVRVKVELTLFEYEIEELRNFYNTTPESAFEIAIAARARQLLAERSLSRAAAAGGK